jgi:Ca2+/Na+ antiporter
MTEEDTELEVLQESCIFISSVILGIIFLVLMLVYAHKSNDDDSYNMKLAKIFTILMCSSFCAAFFSAKHSDAIYERIR